MHIVRHTVTRHWGMSLFVLTVVLLFWLIYVFRTVLFPFGLGLIIAYLLMPLMRWAERKMPYPGRGKESKRIGLIVLVLLILLALLAWFCFVVYTTTIAAFVSFLAKAPDYTSSALVQLIDLLERFRHLFPPQIQTQVDKILIDLGNTVGLAVESLLTNGIALIPASVGVIISMATLPIFLFYLLKDWEKISDRMHNGLPFWSEHIRSFMSIVEKVLGRYIRASLALALVTGVLDYIGLIILGVDFPLVLAVFATVFDLIPTLGPWIAGIIAVVVTLALTPDKTIWVAVLFAGVKIIGDMVLAPKIQGSFMRIHPVIIVILLVLGANVAGFWGLLLAVPLTATAIEIFRYAKQQMQAEDGIGSPKDPQNPGS